MATWRTIYDRFGEALIYTGETSVLELALEQPDDAGGWEPQSLNDRVFVQRVISATGTPLVQALGAITGDLVRFTIAGDETADLPAGAYRHEISEVLPSGRDVLFLGAFVVASAADPDAALPPEGSGVGAAVQFTVQQGARGRVVVRYMGAPGAAGAQRVDIPLSAVGTYTDGELLGTFGLSQEVTVDLADSQAIAKVAPVLGASWRFFRNGVQAFAITWAAGQTVGSLAAVPATLLPGRWDVYAGASADASFADAFVFLVGDRIAA